MKYKEWLSEWLENTVKPTVKERTYEKYERIVNKQIAPLLGEYELGELTPTVLQGFTAKLSERYAANSVNGVVAILRSSLERARAVGLSERQFADCIIRPKQTEKQVESFTANEQKQIEAHILQSRKDKLFGILLCLYSGLRIGELLALRWSDIDFEKAFISVERASRDSWE
ncbi:MAG: site-specific integrase, partial [Clostridiales bacterium]|nr:site-specific integrase [Clostridiales bacterium]